jgi:hypothetical protein
MARDPRTLRLRLVPEIGDVGQARIAAATALVTATGLGGEVEARYLAGAGFGLIRTTSNAVSRAAREIDPRVAISADADPEGPPDPPLAVALAALDPDPEVLAIGQAAARALRQIRVAAQIDVVPVFARPPS